VMLDQHHVGPMARDQLEPVGDAVRSADGNESRLRAQEHRQPRAHRRLRVDDGDPNHALHTSKRG
jgi:hypothetical protein